MFKPLIAVILTLVLFLGGMGKPAYAYSEVKEDYSDLKNGITEVATNQFLKPAIEQTVTVFTGIAICVGADALATSVYPPAVAILPYCPGMGGTVAKSVRQIPVKQVMKTAFNLAR